MTTTINASPSNGIVQTADGSGVMKLQSNGVTTNALAWVNFNGTSSTPITPRANYNISSVTKNSTGDYTLNFTSALSDANYSFVGSCQNSGTGPQFVTGKNSGTYSTTQVAVQVWNYLGTLSDVPIVNIAIFGN